MNAAPVALVGLALLLWAPGRIDVASTGGAAGRCRRIVGRCAPWWAVAPIASACAVVGGLTVGLAAAVAAVTAVHLLTAARRQRADAAERAALLGALRMVVRELRSGAAPEAAVLAAAEYVDGRAAAVLTALAAAAASGNAGPLTGSAGPADWVAGRLQAAVNLSAQQGVPLAGLIDTVCTDLEHRVQAQRARAEQTAGPRFSGYVLAALPLLGVLLGAGMGADPLGVLFGPPPGGLLLPVGVTLACLGLVWAAAITRP